VFRQLVENGRIMSLVIALILVAGLGALNTLTRMEDPRITNRHALIITSFPGASAERIEALITEKLELKLRELPDIKEISSTSGNGISTVIMVLKDTVYDSDRVFFRARNLVADVQPLLPEGALPSRFIDTRGYAYTEMVALRWSGAQPINEEQAQNQSRVLGRYARELQSYFRSVGGTDTVNIYGDPEAEIEVSVDSALAATVGLSARAVAGVIKRADSKVSAGVLQNNFHQMQVEIGGEMDSLERVRRVPLQGEDGRVVRVGDIATVARVSRSPASELSFSRDQLQVVVAARMLPTQRIDKWSEQLKSSLGNFKTLLPANVEAEIIFDQNVYTNKRLGGLVGNIALGFTIILIVLMLTLGMRSALIVASALPLTILFTLVCMKFYGLPIHQMSVTGLIVALGIMVDNAIVMADDVAQKRRRGMDAIDAVKGALGHLWLPLFGSTATTILAFSPIVLMEGPGGEFVGGIALSVIFSLVGSYLISHTIVAGLSGRYLNRLDSTHWIHWGVRVPALTQVFERSLYLALANPGKTLLATLIIPMLGFAGKTQMPDQFFPVADRDMFHIEVYLPTKSSFSNTQALARRIDGVLQNYGEIENSHWFVGRSAPPFYYNLKGGHDGQQFYAQAMIKTPHFSIANRVLPQLQENLDELFPEAQILVQKLEQGPPFDAPVEVRLYGPGVDTLRRLGDQVRLILSQTQYVTHARATLGQGMPVVEVNVREELIVDKGLSLEGISEHLRVAIDGVVAGSVLEGTEELPVRVKIQGSRRQNPSQLADIELLGNSINRGDVIPLSALSELNVVQKTSSIPHRNGRRINTVQGYLRANVLPDTVLREFRQRMEAAQFEMPPGYSLEFGGESAERENSVGNLMSSLGVIAILLVVVLVLSFNSYRIFGIIVAVALLSVGSGILCVYAFGYPFGFIVIVALMGLMGLAINAAIVILAELKANAAAVNGNREAIISSVMSCTRHITSTTITTIGGFTPLILAGGGFWPPFALAIAGGTLLATLLSFYFVPTAFFLFAKRRAFELKGHAPTAV